MAIWKDRHTTPGSRRVRAERGAAPDTRRGMAPVAMDRIPDGLWAEWGRRVVVPGGIRRRADRGREVCGMPAAVPDMHRARARAGTGSKTAAAAVVCIRLAVALAGLAASQ